MYRHPFPLTMRPSFLRTRPHHKQTFKLSSSLHYAKNSELLDKIPKKSIIKNSKSKGERQMGPEYRRPETRDLTLMTVPWVRVGKTAFTPLSRLASRIRSFSLFLPPTCPHRFAIQGPFYFRSLTVLPPPFRTTSVPTTRKHSPERRYFRESKAERPG